MKFSVTELGGIDEDMKLQIHCLEKEAYSHVLRAFIAQSDLLSWVCYSVYDLLLCNSFLTAIIIVWIAFILLVLFWISSLLLYYNHQRVQILV